MNCSFSLSESETICDVTMGPTPYGHHSIIMTVFECTLLKQECPFTLLKRKQLLQLIS